MIIEIEHGLPNSTFFLIVQPIKTYSEPKIGDGKNKTIVDLKHPTTGEIARAELCAVCKTDENDFMHMEIFSRLAYGCSPAYLLKNLIAKYPELAKKFEVEYWLLKRW
jgi:hypothetical protein